jgi:hypothetical protein
MGPIRWIRTIRWSPRKQKTYKLRIDVRIDLSIRIDPFGKAAVLRKLDPDSLHFEDLDTGSEDLGAALVAAF